MRRKQQDKAEFGKRGREKSAPIERVPTSIERLKRFGSRFLSAKKPPKKKNPLGGFRRSRLGT